MVQEPLSLKEDVHRIQRCFCAAYNSAGKEDLSKGYCNSERLLGVTSHFSEIIELHFGKKKMPYIVMYFKAFCIYCI